MTWQRQLQEAVNDPDNLRSQLRLSKNQIPFSKVALAQFPLKAPESFISKIDLENLNDPLLKQIFPAADEEIESTGFVTDPVGDLDSQVTPGLLHKYHGRVLLIVTASCPVHCRYCFRRHYPYSEGSLKPGYLEKALSYIEQKTEIKEVILSGGDPLTLSDKKLFELIKQLESISHLERLRIHTRTPTVLPDRILEADLSWLTETRLNPIIVFHTNHPNEIDSKVEAAVQRLNKPGTLLLNQSVLLKGVNDNAQALISLSEKLFELNVRPYYLHMLDPIKGATHFNVDEETARELMTNIRKKLPGYLIPDLVRETKGELSKTQVPI